MGITHHRDLNLTSSRENQTLKGKEEISSNLQRSEEPTKVGVEGSYKQNFPLVAQFSN